MTLRDWHDGGPLDPPERGDCASAIEQARATCARCPDCDAPTTEARFEPRPPDAYASYGLRCEGRCGWRTSDEDLVEAWAERLADDARAAAAKDDDAAS